MGYESIGKWVCNGCRKDFRFGPDNAEFMGDIMLKQLHREGPNNRFRVETETGLCQLCEDCYTKLAAKLAQTIKEACK